MPIRVALIAAALIATVASAQAAKRLEGGQSGVLSCPTLASMTGILKMAQADFDAAVARGSAEGCKTVAEGTEVFVNETNRCATLVAMNWAAATIIGGDVAAGCNRAGESRLYGMN